MSDPSSHDAAPDAAPQPAPPPVSRAEKRPHRPPSSPRKRKVVDGGFLLLCALTVGAGLAVGMREGWARLASISGDGLLFVAALLPKILCGVFVASALPVLLPREKVAGWIGPDSGLKGLIYAAIAGAIIPGGPMMTFPLAAGMLLAGADLAAAITCITAWSLFGLNRTLIWELSFLHADLVALRVLIALPMPILVGLLVRRVT
ncbi:MAG: permease [Pseudomonadota bacterium]